MTSAPPKKKRASMRPGQSCPGVVAHDEVDDGRAGRFNEAGAIMPRSGRRHQIGLPEGRVASMRPGQSCPGVGWVDQQLIPAELHASMRPGQSCPGVAIWLGSGAPTSWRPLQ